MNADTETIRATLRHSANCASRLIDAASCDCGYPAALAALGRVEEALTQIAGEWPERWTARVARAALAGSVAGPDLGGEETGAQPVDGTTAHPVRRRPLQTDSSHPGSVAAGSGEE